MNRKTFMFTMLMAIGSSGLGGNLYANATPASTTRTHWIKHNSQDSRGSNRATRLSSTTGTADARESSTQPSVTEDSNNGSAVIEGQGYSRGEVRQHKVAGRYDDLALTSADSRHGPSPINRAQPQEVI